MSHTKNYAVQTSKTSDIITPASRLKTLLIISILTAIGILGNAFSVPLFFSVDFIFGSVAAFVALRYFGAIAALVVIIIASSYTFFLWGHPYALLIFTVEIAVVAVLRKYITNYVFADVLFWIFIGAPSAWLLYHFVIGLGVTPSTLIAIKQPLNGIFNAVVASLILDLFATFKRSEQDSRVSAQHLTQNTLIFITLIAGGIPLLLDSYDVIDTREKQLHQQMYEIHGTFANKRLGYQGDILNKELPPFEISKKHIQNILDMHNISLQNFSLVFIHQNGEIVAQYGQVKSISQEGDYQYQTSDIQIWRPITPKAAMRRWAAGEYILKAPVVIDGIASTMIISYSAKPVVLLVEERAHRTMIALLLLMIASLIMSRIITYTLLRPMRNLETASKNFKESFNKSTAFHFPISGIKEYDTLSNSLQEMSHEIHASFMKEEALRNNLEERVKERTAELERLSIVASQTTNGVIITNHIGNIEWVNKGFSKLTGYDVKDVIGKKPGSILQGPETDPETKKRIGQAVRAQQNFQEEILNYNKSGETYWVEIIGSPIKDETGQVSGFVAIQNDITQRKKDLEKIIQSQHDAEAASRAKTNFLATMSHEIRTPLNGILGMAQLIRSSDLTEDQSDKLNTIQHSGKTLLAIINDVLDMSKIEAGAIELEQTSFSLTNLITSSVSAVHSLAHEKGLDFKLTEESELPDILIGDPVRIRQIIWNLLSNAIKFTSKGYVHVSIDCKAESYLAFVEAQKDSVLHIRVSDTGKGMDKSKQKSVFQPFTQEDSSINRSFGGTGLGLSIVKNILELMRGSVHLTSAPNEGSVFDVYIPVTIASQEEAHKHHNKTQNNPNFKIATFDILVAEDNPTNAMIAKAFLEKFNQNVRIAPNGLHAVAAVETRQPDFIFMDIHMPEMNGLEATTAIRQKPENKNIPIVGLTAEAFKDRHEEFKNAGMNDVITKPFNEEQIQEVITRYLADQIPQQRDEQHPPLKASLVETTVDHPPKEQKSLISDPSIGDITSMRETIKSIGFEALKPILMSAPENIHSNFNQLQEALNENNIQKFKEAAHAIKGVSASLYGIALQKHAAELEEISTEENLSNIDLKILEAMIQQTIDWWQYIIDLYEKDANFIQE